MMVFLGFLFSFFFAIFLSTQFKMKRRSSDILVVDEVAKLRSSRGRVGDHEICINLITPPSDVQQQTKFTIDSTPFKDGVLFNSCLTKLADSQFACEGLSPRSLTSIVLKRALSLNELDDESWLSSSFIDLVVTRFAKFYKNVRYLSVDFAQLVSNMTDVALTDINGRFIDYQDMDSPIVFVFNSNNIHWNLIRIVRSPVAELQLFEPMGMPLNRHGGLTYRSVPRDIIAWLDKRCPLASGKSWITIGNSAIVSPQQLTSYDCGVACLLYAEKCGQGEVRLHQAACNWSHSLSRLHRRPRTRSTRAPRRRTSPTTGSCCGRLWTAPPTPSTEPRPPPLRPCTLCIRVQTAVQFRLHMIYRGSSIILIISAIKTLS